MHARLKIGLGFITLLPLLMAPGCGGSAHETSVVVSQKRMEPRPPAVAPNANQVNAAGQANPAEESSARKMIQTATVSVIVTDIEEARKTLEGLLDTHQAFVAKSEFSGHRGTKRSASWTIRVPAEKFNRFVQGVLDLGVPDRHTTESQDVTEEMVDLEARAKNLKAEEETLNRLMKELAKSNAEMITFREQIRQLREQVERAEARLQVLNRLTSLSTLNLSLREEAEYVPPTTPTKPSLGWKIQDTFEASMQMLFNAVCAVLVCLVAIAPWSIVIGLLAVIGWWGVRKIGGLGDEDELKKTPPPVTTPPEAPIPSTAEPNKPE
jgi:hypothetical protein